jgi:hypothetical protein
MCISDVCVSDVCVCLISDKQIRAKLVLGMVVNLTQKKEIMAFILFPFPYLLSQKSTH